MRHNGMQMALTCFTFSAFALFAALPSLPDFGGMLPQLWLSSELSQPANWTVVSVLPNGSRPALAQATE